ncbi:hypothetical protein [Vibrio fortis]|uniref:hypothetical protein n=1 Tax=Vibrio fortis TaxID=212667 RepID=UPI003EB96AAF
MKKVILAVVAASVLSGCVMKKEAPTIPLELAKLGDALFYQDTCTSLHSLNEKEYKDYFFKNGIKAGVEMEKMSQTDKDLVMEQVKYHAWNYGTAQGLVGEFKARDLMQKQCLAYYYSNNPEA